MRYIETRRNPATTSLLNAGTTASGIYGNVIAIRNINVDMLNTYAQGGTGFRAVDRDRGLEAFFSMWMQIISGDRGGFAGGRIVAVRCEGTWAEAARQSYAYRRVHRCRPNGTWISLRRWH